MDEFNQALGHFLATVWKHRWTFGVPVALMCVPATLHLVRQPETWEAQLLVHAQPLQAKSAGDVLPRILDPRPSDAVDHAGAVLLEQRHVVAAAAVLAPGAGPSDRRALARVAGKFAYAREGGQAFSVTCTDTSPRRAADAVNALVRSFLDNEREVRRKRAEGFLRFLEGERQDAEDTLAATRGRLADFNAAHADSLPEDEASLVRKLTLLVAQRQVAETDVRDRGARAEDLAERLAALPGLAFVVPEDPAVTARRRRLESALTDEQRVLTDTRKELVRVQATFTGEQEEVVRVREQVDSHRAEVARIAGELDELEGREAERQAAVRTRDLGAQRKLLEEQLVAARRARDQAAVEVTGVREKEAGLEERLARIPETAALQRPLVTEIEEARQRLDGLEEQARQARAIALFCAQGEAGEVTGYRVSEWALPPLAPAGPSPARHYATAGVLGLLLGYCVLALRRRTRSQRLTGPDDVHVILPRVEVLALSEGALAWVRRGVGEVLGLALLLFGLGFSALLLAASRGWIEPPPWLGRLL